MIKQVKLFVYQLQKFVLWEDKQKVCGLCDLIKDNDFHLYLHSEMKQIEKIKTMKKNIGYNVLTGEYVDMIKAGVIDPVKVVRGALENAASIAAMILTTDVLITDMPEKDKAPAMPPGGMGGMDN